MSKNWPGGFITKTAPTPTGGVNGTAPGIWTLGQALNYIKLGQWPETSYRVIQIFNSSSTWTAPTGVTQVGKLS